MQFLTSLVDTTRWAAPGASADLHLRILGGKHLPKTDIVGHSDPYFVLTVGKGEQAITHRTAVAYNTGSPVWQHEELYLQNVPPGCPLRIEVWDRDRFTADDYVGCNKPELTVEVLKQGGPANSWVLKDVAICGNWRRRAGVITIQYLWGQSTGPPGPMLHRGPARYRIALSPLAGKVVAENVARWRPYAAFKVQLAGERMFFPAGDAQPWNRDYDKARQIFTSKVLMSGVVAQHSVLYADHKKQENLGVLRTGEDLLKLLDYGMRGGQNRYFTYVLMGGSLRFSETGAAFLADMMSKHAMHSGCAEQVTLAGEFCIIPNTTDSSHILIVDNNSGTYAPPDSLLPAFRDLLCYNLTGLEVQCVGAGDPLLKHYHSLVPSRSMGG